MTDASNEPTAEAESAANAAGALCENCGRPRADRFCSLCGQNDRTYTRSLFPVLGELVRESFEFDGRLAQTLKLLLFKPGSLSTEFSRNRRARYMTPVRLYLFTSVIFFLTMSLVMSRVSDLRDGDPDQDPSSSFAEIPGEVMDSLQVAMDSLQAMVPGLQLQIDGEDVPVSAEISESGIAALRANLAPSQHGKLDDLLNRESERAQVGLAILAAAFDSEAQASSVGGRQADPGPEVEPPPGADSTAQTAGTAAGDPPRGAAVVLPGFRGFLARMILNTAIDLLHDSDAFIERTIGNLSIAMFFLLPVYALILAVFYWRQKRYYIEHLVFGMHVHSFLFIIVTLMLIASLTPMGAAGQAWTQGILGLTVFAYPIIALRRFYANGWFFTLVKAFLLGTLYFTISVPLTMVVLFLTA
ncbi:MAG: DUF3667 domain-containing protein [Gemmatimonadetes bacterium]|nr:DUF3667 domain-containing protein [Gemmatimonadota bacterium]MCY3679012.1 DUF3667 domain-containing protein [Gemmatimonadota bacterium]MYA40887.1 DUF3667 domain-containing protein [Gemmatimonadota bacterium]MYE91944.1 DUF3667 domain-containing protein [Gemmatimonadota bacterium]MYJ11632.1 DUF3667 domain-containing protein [Gemmatimonadota bacterium]